jgi:hypothetical protein
MKNRKKSTITIITVFLLVVISIYAHKEDNTHKSLRDRGVIFKDIGNNEALMIILTREEGNAYWFLIRELDNLKLGKNLSSLWQVDSLLPSPDGKYLAVLSVGEGHPILEIVDLQTLRTQKKYMVLKELNPYPGIIYIQQWQPGQLIVESDMPLNLKKKNENFDLDQQLKEVKPFSINITTGTIKEVKKRNFKK